MQKKQKKCWLKIFCSQVCCLQIFDHILVEYCKKDFQKKDNNLDTKKKRVSYRAKANDFEKKKNITKTESNNKSRSQVDNLKQIKVLPENNDKKIEKRQGWWSQ